MRWGLILVVLAAVALRADEPVVNPPSKQDVKQARQAFDRGMKLQSQNRTDEAYEEFLRAATLVPRDAEYVAAREVVRQQLVFRHIEEGNRFLMAQNQLGAVAEFRLALHYDPKNEYAQERVSEALAPPGPKPSPKLETLVSSGVIELQPAPGRADFQLRGDARSIIQQIAQRFGISVVFDQSVQSRPVRLDLGDADFATAMHLAMLMDKAFYAPVSARQIIVAADTPENHRQFDRMVLRTYYVSGATTPAEVNEMLNLLRTIFEVRYVSAQPAQFTITARAPQKNLAAAEDFIHQGGLRRPQIALDIKVYEIDRQYQRNLGVQLPTQGIRMINIPSAALQLLSSPNIQQLINQLIASGGINQASSQDLAALLAQLAGQQNSLLNVPIATFGGGLTLMGVIIPGGSLTYYMTDARIATVEHATLRAQDLSPVDFRLGERFPILNTSFSPILNSPALAQVIGNHSFQAPFPSFNFEDLGLTVKATPHVHGQESVGLDLDLNIEGLAPQTLNGIPELNHREYKGWITLKDGESAIVAADLTESEQRSLSGVPGLVKIPIVRDVTSNRNKQLQQTELLITITPHLLSAPHDAEPGAEYWLQ